LESQTGEFVLMI